MLGKGIAVEIVAEATGLPLARVEQLRQESSTDKA